MQGHMGITIRVYGNVYDPRGTQRGEVKDAVTKALAKALKGVDVALVEVELHE